MAISFPAAPVNGQVESFQGRQYQYNTTDNTWSLYGGLAQMSYTKPTSPKNGEIYYNEFDNTFELWNDQTSSWIVIPGAGGEVVPVGTVQYFAATSAPAGWLKANGDTVSNGVGTVQGITADFSTLYSIIGSSFGGAGKLPDLRGEFIRGWDDSRGVDNLRVFGTSQSDEFQTHSHEALNPPGDTNDSSSQGWVPLSGTPNAFRTTENVTTNSTAGLILDAGNSTETRPRNVSLLACIKYATVSTISNSITNLYVDANTGDDSNNGQTALTAFATLEKGISQAQLIEVPPGSFLNINVAGGWTITSPIDISHKNGNRVKIISTPLGVTPPGYSGGLTIGADTFRGTNSSTQSSNFLNMHNNRSAQIFCAAPAFTPVFTCMCGAEAIGFENVLFTGNAADQIAFSLPIGSQIVLKDVGIYNFYAFGISFGGRYCFEGQCVATDLSGSLVALEGSGEVYAQNFVIKNFRYAFNAFGAADVNIRCTGEVTFQRGDVVAEVNDGGRVFFWQQLGTFLIDDVNLCAVGNTGASTSYRGLTLQNYTKRSYTNNGHITYRSCNDTGNQIDDIFDTGPLTVL